MTLKEKIEKIEELFPGNRFTAGAGIKEDGVLDFSGEHSYLLQEPGKRIEDDRLFLGTLRVYNFLPVADLSKLESCAGVLGATLIEIGGRDFETMAIHFHYVPTKLEIQEAKIVRARKVLSDLENELAELKTIEKCKSAPTA